MLVAGQHQRRCQQHPELRQRDILGVGEGHGADTLFVEHQVADRDQPQQRAMAGLVHLGDSVEVGVGVGARLRQPGIDLLVDVGGGDQGDGVLLGQQRHQAEPLAPAVDGVADEGVGVHGHRWPVSARAQPCSPGVVAGTSSSFRSRSRALVTYQS